MMIALLLVASGANGTSGKPASTPVVRAPATPESAKPADWDLRVERGILLAKSVQPEEDVVSFALRQMDENLVPMLRSSPQMKEIETQYPGFSERYYASGRPVLEHLLRSRLPDLWKAMAQAYAGEMTPQQIDEAAAFYRSPPGQKVIREMNERLNVKPMLQSGLRQGLEGRSDAVEARQQLEEASNKAAMSSLASLSAPERSLLVKFLVSPAGKSLRRAGPAIADVISKWMTADDPEAEAQMGETALSVLAKMQAEKEAGQK